MFTRAAAKNLGTSDLTGLQAGGADVHLAAGAVHNNIDALDVGTELTDGNAVRVADGATSNGVLTADLANFGHGVYPPWAARRECRVNKQR